MQHPDQPCKANSSELKDSLDRGIDTQTEDDAPENDEATYRDGSLQNECWRVD